MSRIMVGFSVARCSPNRRLTSFPVRSRMDPSMAVRTQCCHPARMVGAAVSPAPEMMRFEIGPSILPQEGRIVAAAFALPLGAAQDVDSHGLTAFVGSDLTLLSCGALCTGCLSELSEGRQRHAPPASPRVGAGSVRSSATPACSEPSVRPARRRSPAVVCQLDRALLRRGCVSKWLRPHTAPARWRRTRTGAATCRWPSAREIARLAAFHLHIADLALAGVPERPVGLRAVAVAVRRACSSVKRKISGSWLEY